MSLLTFRQSFSSSSKHAFSFSVADVGTLSFFLRHYHKIIDPALPDEVRLQQALRLEITSAQLSAKGLLMRGPMRPHLWEVPSAVAAVRPQAAEAIIHGEMLDLSCLVSGLGLARFELPDRPKGITI
jgi:hypothetical protein